MLPASRRKPLISATPQKYSPAATTRSVTATMEFCSGFVKTMIAAGRTKKGTIH